MSPSGKEDSFKNKSETDSFETASTTSGEYRIKPKKRKKVMQHHSKENYSESKLPKHSKSKQLSTNDKPSVKIKKEKTMLKYKNTYKKFINWKLHHEENELTEELLLKYFQELAITKSGNTIRVAYGMLKVMIKRKHDIDLGKFGTLYRFVQDKWHSKVPTTKQLTAENVETFLKEAPDTEYLLLKVLLIFMNRGCSIGEMMRLYIDDVSIDTDTITVILQNVREETHKTHRSKSFIIRDNDAKIVNKYISLRPTNLETDKFLIGYKEGKFENRPVCEIHYFGISKRVAKFLKLSDPEMYIGRYSYRKDERTKIRRIACTRMGFKSTKHLTKASKRLYKKRYDDFIHWKSEKKEEQISEQLLLEYLQKLSETKSPCSVYSTYTMLNVMIQQENNVDINGYKELQSFARQQNEKIKAIVPPNKTKLLSPENIEKFLKDAPDRDYLVTKAVLIVGINGGCNIVEFLGISIDDVQKHSDTEISIEVRDSKTNNTRNFFIRNEHAKILNKYMKLRPTNLDTDKFFIFYRKGKFFRSPIGRNEISRMARNIAGYLKLPNPERYLADCFRKSAPRQSLNIHIPSRPKTLDLTKDEEVEENDEEENGHIVEEYVFDYNTFNKNKEVPAEFEVFIESDRKDTISLDDSDENMNADLEYTDKDPKQTSSFGSLHIFDPKTSKFRAEVNIKDPLKDNEDDNSDEEECNTETKFEKKTVNQNVKETVISLPNKTVKIVFIDCENVSNITINVSKS